MKSIAVNTGIKQYVLGDAEVQVQFNPTDIAFAKRIASTFNSVSEILDGFEPKLKDAANDENPSAFFDMTEEAEKKIRDELDELFQTQVCTPLYGTVSVMAISDGLPLWANLLMSILDELDVSLDEEKKNSQRRIKKYTEKYRSRKK